MRSLMNRRQFLRGTLAAGAVLAVGPQETQAQDGVDYYGAIAFSQTTGSVGAAWGHRTQAAAEQTALAQCRGPNARIALWVRNAWAALVVGRGRGYGTAWGANSGDVINEAFNAGNRVDRGTFLAGFIHSSPLAPINYDYGAIPDDFGRRGIIREAMNTLHNRFRDLIIGQNTYSVLRGGAFIEAGVMRNHGLGDSEAEQNGLLWRQLSFLRLSGTRFPRVVFRTANHDAVAWAWGRTGLVTTRGPADVQGEFEVQVSLRYLGGGGNQSDPVNWASVIAHELLHNLGHKHELDNYTDNRQINVFQKAVFHNGAYRRGLVCPGFV